MPVLRSYEPIGEHTQLAVEATGTFFHARFGDQTLFVVHTYL